MQHIGYRHYPSELTFRLPPSKSILARMVLLRLVEEVAYGRAFLYDDLPVVHAASDDVVVMLRFAQFIRQVYPDRGSSTLHVFDCGESGTALRLITAFCAALPIHVRLTTRGRLSSRPMDELLEVLTGWGASFDFDGVDKESDTGLIVHGAKLTPKDIPSTDKWRSSQFVSALILISPLVGSDFSILRSPKSPSSRYISLTISVMKSFGYDIEWNSNKITCRAISPTPSSRLIPLESDWSSSSYWYQLMVLHPEIRVIHLPGLRIDTAQPDMFARDIFATLGVDTHLTSEGISLCRNEGDPLYPNPTFDLTQAPDLFPALFCTLLGLGIPFEITGISLLGFKESDRISAVIEGAETLGYHGVSQHGDRLIRTSTERTPPDTATVDGFMDHRIVMAFGVLATAIRDTRVTISDADAVRKSYPDFFNHLSTSASL